MQVMSSVTTYLGSRLLYLLCGCAVGTLSLVHVAESGHRGTALIGLGCIFMGMAGFLQPPVLDRKFFTKPLFSLGDRVAPAVGNQGLRSALTVAAVACFVVGFVLRFLVGV